MCNIIIESVTMLVKDAVQEWVKFLRDSEQTPASVTT